jgi:hypothetical protein
MQTVSKNVNSMLSMKKSKADFETGPPPSLKMETPSKDGRSFLPEEQPVSDPLGRYLSPSWECSIISSYDFYGRPYVSCSILAPELLHAMPLYSQKEPFSYC